MEKPWEFAFDTHQSTQIQCDYSQGGKGRSLRRRWSADWSWRWNTGDKEEEEEVEVSSSGSTSFDELKDLLDVDLFYANCTLVGEDITYEGYFFNQTLELAGAGWAWSSDHGVNLPFWTWYKGWVKEFDHQWTFDDDRGFDYSWEYDGKYFDSEGEVSIEWGNDGGDWAQEVWGYVKKWFPKKYQDEKDDKDGKDRRRNPSGHCPRGSYEAETCGWRKTKCFKCPEGCKDCSYPDQCTACGPAFDLI